MKILMIDNYDSFTYNLVQYLGELGADVTTVRNDQYSLNDVIKIQADGVVISPGPCTPNEAGVSLAAVAHFAGRLPLLGICLGHQAIGMHYGAQLIKSKRVMHGKVDQLHHTGAGSFDGLKQGFDIVRYHSLAISDLPVDLEKTAWTDDGEIMAVRHRDVDVEGIQFHPESIASAHGHDMLAAFLKRVENQTVGA